MNRLTAGQPGGRNQRPDGTHQRQAWTVLLVAGLICWSAYAAVAVLSRQFVHGQGFTERPIPAVLGMLGLAFAWYLAAIFAAVRIADSGRLLGVVVAGSLLFRLTLLFSGPIQEVDAYRYLWDGAATANNVSPFRYSPQQVLDASPDEVLPDDLRRLVALGDSSDAMGTILARVDYAELPTVYPPVSQAVFALCSLVTPQQSSVFQRLVAMKICFLLFDLATLAVVVGLLRSVGQHVGWSVAYGWCPLMIKEIANSAHLDAVAVFLASLAILVAVRTIPSALPDRLRRGGRALRESGPALRGTLLSAAVLGLAVGAKLYPIVLAPLLAATWLRRFGWRPAVAGVVVFLLVVSVVLWPMVRPPDPAAYGRQDVASAKSVNPGQISQATNSHPSVASLENPPRPQDPTRGLKTFLGRWEMNDFLFLVLVENVKPQAAGSNAAEPWFVVLPQPWRVWLTQGIAGRFDVKPSATAFFLTRTVTSAVFFLLAISWAWRAAGSGLPNQGNLQRVSQPAASRRSMRRSMGRLEDLPRGDFLRAAFLTVAWFWLLSPTQNPWYWCWAMPLVVFAGSRMWLLVSGLTLIYYLRFWLGYHWPEESVLGSGYSGKLFFDYVVTWLEFGPWLLGLALVWMFGRHTRRDFATAEEESYHPAGAQPVRAGRSVGGDSRARDGQSGKTAPQIT